MHRPISNPSDLTHVLAADTVEDLPKIIKDGYDEQGTTVIVTSTVEVDMLNSKKEWVKL